ncbi:MAG TPA: acetoacetate decarboxylase family protein, partial [Phototrophicaceae bacterium]|nr:acetoacetate decarboxylase family protein [Phototrophicaceae bacterium]
MEMTAPSAPWNLTGNGYILLYKFPRNFGIAHSPFGIYKGGFGAIMLVDYQTTPVGPYRELLFIPGQVMYPGKTGYSISKIYVSSIESVIGGQTNWGIPKELAEFEWRSKSDQSDEIQVSREGKVFFEISLKVRDWHFPVNAALMPPVVQHREGKTFITRLKSTAQGQFASIKYLKQSGTRKDFPAINQFQPLTALKVTGFQMTFP